MKSSLAVTVLFAGALWTTGCATKKYVHNVVDPVTGKVTQVADQANKTDAALAETRKDVEKNATDISAANERAIGADKRAGDALNQAGEAGKKADLAGQKADKTARDLGDLRSAIANIDDYKSTANVAVPFGFNKWKLSADSQAQLDQLASQAGTMKHYFIAVEGYTDQTGNAQYNVELSRKRAQEVVQYLVSKHDIPVYRVHEIGLGKEKPVDDGKGRVASAKNRRVEVTIYSADDAMKAVATAKN